MKKNEETAKGFSFLFATLSLHSIFGILLSLLLSLIGSILVLTEAMPESSILQFSLFAVFFGALLASILSCRRLGKPIYTALLQSLLLLATLYLIGALLYGRLVPQTHIISTFACLLAGSVSGAVFSAFGKRRKKHNKK